MCVCDLDLDFEIAIESMLSLFFWLLPSGVATMHKQAVSHPHSFFPPTSWLVYLFLLPSIITLL